MPNLPPDTSLRSKVLEEYLRGVLPSSQVRAEEVESAHQPLVLLQTKNVMAGFGFANGDMARSYEALYHGFKQRYFERRQVWDALDIAFVLCVSPDVPNIDRFSSNVETDVFFCRKFVVPFALPISTALARLPFLPLSPVETQALRPPSAQTFLQRAGVPTVLSRYIVVRGEASPERIAENCESGSFGEPAKLSAPGAAEDLATNADRIAAPIRLDAVTIRDFRAYRKPQTFQLGADLTVLYGPNGFGKTSFFDAVDFAATGEIGRFKGFADSRFQKLARHLDAKDGESTVTLRFSAGGSVRNVKRKVADPRNAQLDGVSVDRKAVLAELTSGDIPATDRVENFISLFRATHLFSQEHQELAQGFRDTCQLSAGVVSRLLALEDYARADGKAEKVRDQLKSQVDELKQSMRTLSEEAANDKAELERLRKFSQAPSTLKDLDGAIDDLLRRIQKAEIVVSASGRDAQTIRSWRAAIQGRRTDHQLSAERLSALAKDAARLPSLRDELGKQSQELASKESTITQLDRKRPDLEKEFGSARTLVAQLRAKRSDSLALLGALNWTEQTIPTFLQLTQSEAQLVRELAQLKSQLLEMGELVSRLSQEIASSEDSVRRLTDGVVAAQARLKRTETLVEACPLWRSNRAKLRTESRSQGDQITVLEQLNKDAHALTSQIASLRQEEERISKQIADVERNSSELKRLLSQFQSHVQTGTCPLCGEDHGSKEELLKRIAAQVAVDSATASRTALASVRSNIARCSQQLTEIGSKRASLEAALATSRQVEAKLKADVASFEGELASLGIVGDYDSPPVEQVLNDHLSTAQREKKSAEELLQETRAKAESSRKVLLDRRAAFDARKSEHDAKEARLVATRAQIKTIRDDPRQAKAPIDTAVGVLANSKQATSQSLENINGELTSAEDRVTKLQEALANLTKESNALRAAIQGLRDRTSNLQKQIADIAARLDQANLPKDASETVVLDLVSRHTKNQAELLEMGDAAAAIEAALDTASTAAAFSRLQQSVTTKEKVISTAAERCKRLEPWIAYFDSMRSIVASEQHRATEEFTRGYGPRTSIIQKRLRSVYGFDEIEIKAHDSTIQVRVKRRGEDLRPTDYFSQSQQQTLLLGLFLTAYLSQTWSCLSPIFLDDPVTHFDDLNTYAFLDLIAGLIESDPGRHQFVVSTCDERFLALALQRFRRLGNRATFYKFAAIGTDGPVVQQLQTQGQTAQDTH